MVRATTNMFPAVLVAPDYHSERLGGAQLDLMATSGGHDFVLQAANTICARAAFRSMKLPWISGPIDAQAVAAIENDGSASAGVLRAWLADAGLGSAAGLDVLVQLTPREVLFDESATCRIRATVQVALGRMTVLPREPELSHPVGPGEAVQQLVEQVTRLAQRAAGDHAGAIDVIELRRTVGEMLAGVAPDLGSASTRTLIVPPPSALSTDVDAPFNSFQPMHVELGARTTFDVIRWMGSGVLDVQAPFESSADKDAAVLRVAAVVDASTARFEQLASNVEFLLSDADPAGLVLKTTHRIRERGRLALVDDVSLVGGPASARVPQLQNLSADAFPVGTGACPLNVTATFAPGQVGARSKQAFVSRTGYGTIWSADAVALLIRHCWESYNFPRSITQTTPVTVNIGAGDTAAVAFSDIRLESLDTISLEFDSNGRTDVLHTAGMARVVPRMIRLADGRELTPKNPNDPLFAPGPPRRWSALGLLTEQPPAGATPEILWFERAVTAGTTSRLGRPFSEPESGRTVTHSRISAPSQRILLLAD